MRTGNPQNPTGNNADSMMRIRADQFKNNENSQNCCVFGLSQRLHGSSFLFPGYVDSAIAGSGRGKEPSGRSVLRPIQIRLTISSFEKISLACHVNSPQARSAAMRLRWNVTLVNQSGVSRKGSLKPLRGILPESRGIC